MILYSTGQISGELLSITQIRVDMMNKTATNQLVRVIVFDTTTSPKTSIFSETFMLNPISGDSRVFTPIVFPDQYEVEIHTNHERIVPLVTGITNIGVVEPTATFKYGNLFRAVYSGTVTFA